MQYNSSYRSQDCDGNIGPVDLINHVGLDVYLPLYTAGFGLVIIFLVHALYHWYKSDRRTLRETYLIFFPSLAFIPIFLPLLSPPIEHIMSLIQDLLTFIAMLVYLRFTIKLIKGKYSLLDTPTREPPSCPIGTPPGCCLVCCPKPKVTQKIIDILLIPLPIIIVVIFLHIVVFSALAFNRLPVPEDVYHVTTLSSLILVPFQISTVYTYKVIIALAEPKLTGSYPRLRGRLIFLIFILGKVMTGIFVLLVEGKVLTPLHTLDCVNLKQVLLPIFRMLIVIPPAGIIPPLYSRKWNLPQLCEKIITV